MPTYFNSFLGGVTMYRLMLYFLLALLALAVYLGLAGLLPYSGIDIFLTGVFLGLICNVSNYLLARLFGARANLESASITALILTFIVGPLSFAQHFLFLTALGVLAMLSKYVIAVGRKHVFNPAALAVLVMGVVFGRGASWWIGGFYTLPLVVLGGLLVLLKIRRLGMVLGFFAVYLLAVFLGSGLPSVSLLASPVWFFIFVMLVEPLTSPSTRNLQVAFGVFVALALFFIQRLFPAFPYSLEASLLAGNVFSFLASPVFNVVFEFKRKEEVARDTWAFYFESMGSFKFIPGQFMEWIYLHPKVDLRGFRRYFTISSSPTEKYVVITMRYFGRSSSFKRAFFNIRPGERVTALGPLGEFVLPKEREVPLCFVAGGVGITPFRSMVGYLLDKDEKRDIVLLYSNHVKEEVAFKEIFDKVGRVGVRSIYVMTGKDGYIDEEMIRMRVPDYERRVFYVSGPQPMVEAFEKMLSRMKIKKIKTDFFPGYTDKHQ